ncbi:MAG: hypothetical protein FD188_2839 [Ignavibacteria bacterium]|nr:MAG: hypothetical protein FD188_2839 [Ignavibacteria bacterium]
MESKTLSYPNHFILACFSEICYEPQEEGKALQTNNKVDQELVSNFLSKWKVCKVLDKADCGKYYGVVFENEKENQIVLAHRGTPKPTLTMDGIRDLLTTNSPLGNDLSMILEGQVGTQESAAYDATRVAVELAKEKNFTLTLTGHSLGAFLAEISIFYCHNTLHYYQAKAVTFESPGCKRKLKEMASNIETPITKARLENLNIITYLSSPNLVNVCDKHVGQNIYLIFPNEQVPHEAKRGRFDMNSHLMKGILESFNTETFKPKDFQIIEDWPSIQYKGDRGALNLPPILKPFKLAWKYLWKNIQLQEFNQAVRVFTDEEQLTPAECGIAVKRSRIRIRERTHKYRLEKLPGHGTSLWYLLELSKHGLPNLPAEISSQIETLLNSFKVRKESGNNSIGLEIESMNAQTIDEIEETMFDIVTLSSFQLFNEIQIGLQSCPTLSSNLPKWKYNKEFYINVKNDDGQCFLDVLSQKISTSSKHIVVIKGHGGIGKSLLAFVYADLEKSRGRIIRWIEAEEPERIRAEYMEILRNIEGVLEWQELRKTKPPSLKELTYIIKNKISKLQANVLLVFDNVQSFSDIEPYLLDMPDSSSVIITTSNLQLTSSLNQNSIELKDFSQQEAFEYMTNALASEHQNEDLHNTIIKIVEHLMRNGVVLPIEINLVANILLNERITPADFLKSCLNETSQISFLAIIGYYAENAKFMILWLLMQRTVFLDPDFINFKILDKLIGAKISQSEMEVIKSQSIFQVVKKENKSGLKIHRLLQGTMLEVLKEKKLGAVSEDELLENTVEILDELYEDIEEMPGESWEIGKDLERHVEKIVKMHERIKNQKKALTRLLRRAAEFHERVSVNYEVRIKYLKISELLITEQNKEERAAIMVEIGTAYSDNGETQKAIENYNEALKIRREILPANHPDIASILNNLGGTYSDNGETKKAIECYI